MGAFDYFKTCMTKKFADFDGRARRSEYWYFILFFFLVYIGLFMIAGGLAFVSGILGGIFSFLAIIFLVAAIIPSLAVAIRRMHDVGKSGWFILIPIYSFILACTDSEPGSNEYGPNPKTGESDVTDHLV